MVMDLVREFIGISEEVKQSDAYTKELKKKKAEVEAKLFDAFAEAGITSMNVNGKNVYAARVTTVRAEDMRAIVKYLEDNKYESLVSVNSNSLRSFVNEQIQAKERELGEDAETMTPQEIAVEAFGKDFASAISVGEVHQLRVRKA